jgi:hypothetical protein
LGRRVAEEPAAHVAACRADLVGMGLPEVSTILWRERNLLELLLFKLEEERLVLTAGLDRWLPRATREVELVLAELQRIEEPRSGALDGVAAELGLQPGRTLREVAAAAPAPWGGLLEQHREAFVATTREIGPLERAHRKLLGSQEPEAALAWLEARMEPPHPGDDGPRPAPSAERAMLRLVPEGS